MMKYPDEITDSKPVVGQEAEALLEAIDSGKARTNKRAEATIARILQNRKTSSHGQQEQIRGGDVSSAGR